MQAYMRNKTSGEIRDVELDSPEFRGLQREVTSLGQPLWEQTSFPHAQAIKERAKFGELNEEDLGHEDQDELRFAALKLAAEGVSPERNPHLSLSPGEIEMGLTPEQKLQDLEDQYDNHLLGKRRKLLGNAADAIADEREERESAPISRGQTSRAGGSDVRENAPRAQATDGDGTPANTGGQTDTETDTGSSKPPGELNNLGTGGSSGTTAGDSTGGGQ